MGNRRKSLPAVPPNVDPALRPLLSAVAEIVETGEGVRGNPLDQKLTLRDLLDSGIGGLRRGARPGSPGSLVPGDGAPPNMSVPPAPTSLVVTGGLGYIFLDWGIPQHAYGNHGYTEVWRHTEDNLANAVLHGQTGSSMFADMNTQVGETYYYWIRFVSSTNVKGPYNNPNGTSGQESEDPQILLGRLSGEIRESHLYERLNERIDLIDGPPELAGSVAQRVQNEAIERALAVQAESEARGTAISAAYSDLMEYADTSSAAAQTVNQLVVAFGGNAASALSYAVSEVDNNLSVTSTFNQYNARFSNIEDDLDNKASITFVNQAVSDEESARTTQFNQLSSEISDLEGDINSKASVAYVDDAVSTESSARASAISQLSSTVDGNTATIQTQQETLDGLSAQWGVKTSVGDLVGGVGLYNDGNKVSFLASVDNFGIIAPGAETLSFFVEDGRVVMDAASIVNLAVTDAQIGSVSVGKVTGLTGAFIETRIQNLHADKITGDVNSSIAIPSSASRVMSRDFIYSRSGVTIPAQARPRFALFFVTATLDTPTGGSRNVRALLYADRGDSLGGSTMSPNGNAVNLTALTPSYTAAKLTWSGTGNLPSNWNNVAVGDEIRMTFANGATAYGRVSGKLAQSVTREVEFERVIFPGAAHGSSSLVTAVQLKKGGTQARFNWSSPVLSQAVSTYGVSGGQSFVSLYLGALGRSSSARSYVFGIQVIGGSTQGEEHTVRRTDVQVVLMR